MQHTAYAMQEGQLELIMPGAKMHHAVHLEFKDPIDQDSGDSGPASGP